MKSVFSLMNQLKHNAAHYDGIEDAWRYVLGDNFHVGYFESEGDSLDDATDRLIDKMASFGKITNQSEVLDVGCGVGQPAFYLNAKLGCSIVGISTSETCILAAEKDAEEKGVADKVRFRVANALDNGLDDQFFDIVWIMEASHLMKDKKRLIKECKRVLKPGGSLLLCDFILARRYSLRDRLAYLTELKLDYVTGIVDTIRAFGRTSTETVDFYKKAMFQSGFNDVEALNVSDEVKPTFEHWRLNTENKRQNILKTFSQKQVEQLIKGSRLLEYLFSRKVFGYWIVKAS